METRTNLDKWLYLVRRIEEHREEKAVKELQKLYKKLIKDLRGKMGNLYADYADPETGKLTYEAMHRQGLDARLLEEVAANVASVTADESRIIRETVEQTYANCYSGMVQAVQQAVDNEELHEAFASVEAVKPEVVRAAVDNPVHGLTLSDQLEKNRADIIWGIKQAVGVGLSEGDNYSTMARRIQKELIGPDGAGGSYYKAVRIARTEAHRVREEGNLDAAQNLTEQLEPAGITMMKTWHTMKDERVRPSRSRKTKDGWKYSKSGKYDHQKMEGVQVPIKDDFTLPSGAKTQAPGKSGVAGEDINCRCFLSYEVREKTTIQEPSFETLSGELKEYSEEELIKIAKETDSLTGQYIMRESKWSGRIVQNSEHDYAKDWNCDIISLKETSPHILLHECIHARSCSYFSPEMYEKFALIEEGSVQLLAQEISKKHGIKIIPSAYDELANALRTINKRVSIANSDIEFAQELMNQEMPKRLEWIEEKINALFQSGGEVGDYLDAMRELEKVTGGRS